MDKLYFITSSRIKLLHAQHLAKEYQLSVAQQIYYGRAYIEPRTHDRETLLEASFLDAYKRWSKGTAKLSNFFFIEDTSVILPALSNPEKEFPGTDVKYWMASTSFEQLNRQPITHKNNRDAIVRSDVLLYLPSQIIEALNHTKPFIQFTGYTYGKVVESEQQGTPNAVYPWLDQKSFNKWFIPTGSKVPLSLLPVDEADRHDIRKNSIGAMLSFLHKNHLIRRNSKNFKQPVQSLLFSVNTLFIVCGLTCAGKSTLGSFLSKHCGYFHSEASDFMRVAFELRNRNESTQITLEAFATQALRDDPSIVSGQIVDILKSVREPIIITGFRSPKEIAEFRHAYKGSLQIQIVIINSNEDLPFARAKRRDREDAPTTLSELKKRDKTQLEMGLKEIREQHLLDSITNEQTVANFLNEFVLKFKINATLTVPRSHQISREGDSLGLEERIILSLFFLKSKDATNFWSTTEIARIINSFFKHSSIVTSKNNISRYFNQFPRAFFRKRIIKNIAKYTLSQSGISKAYSILRNKNSQQNLY